MSDAGAEAGFAVELPVFTGPFRVLADLLRRAGRYDEAIDAVASAEATLDPEDEEQSGTATVLGFIRELAEAGDDEAHSVVEAFAAEE